MEFILWNFHFWSWTARFGLPDKANGRGIAWLVIRRSGVAVGRMLMLLERRGRAGRSAIDRGMIDARWDDNCDNRCGEGLGIMVRLPALGRGG
jgi:hypothetical protein